MNVSVTRQRLREARRCDAGLACRGRRLSVAVAFLPQMMCGEAATQAIQSGQGDDRLHAETTTGIS